MQIIKHNERAEVHKDGSVSVWEYPTEGKNINGAVAVVSGRYPDTGFVKNRIVTELVYVVSGRGQILSQQQARDLGAGDFVRIEPEELFAWSGTMELVIVTTPAFAADQYVHVA